MAFIKALSKGTLTAAFLIAVNVSAQVSFVEGIEPLEGVVIPKANQPQAVNPGAVFKDCDDCPEMVVIPAGGFLMGSPPDPESDPFSNSKPLKIGEDNEKLEQKKTQFMKNCTVTPRYAREHERWSDPNFRKEFEIYLYNKCAATWDMHEQSRKN